MRDRHFEIVPSRRNRHSARLLWHHLGNRVAMMEARGYSIRDRDRYVFRVLKQLDEGRLDEGLLDALGSALVGAGNSSLSQGLKEMMGAKLVEMMGLRTDSFLGRTIVNFIGNVTPSEIISFFSGGDKCKLIASKLSGSIQESLFEEFITVPNGLEPSSLLGKTIVEALKAQFIEGGPVVEAITSAVCKFNISDLLPGVKSTGTKTDILGSITSAVQGVGAGIEGLGGKLAAAAAPAAAE
jgi:hypothetical protein